MSVSGGRQRHGHAMPSLNARPGLVPFAVRAGRAELSTGLGGTHRTNREVHEASIRRDLQQGQRKRQLSRSIDCGTLASASGMYVAPGAGEMQVSLSTAYAQF